MARHMPCIALQHVILIVGVAFNAGMVPATGRKGDASPPMRCRRSLERRQLAPAGWLQTRWCT